MRILRATTTFSIPLVALSVIGGLLLRATAAGKGTHQFAPQDDAAVIGSVSLDTRQNPALVLRAVNYLIERGEAWSLHQLVRADASDDARTLLDRQAQQVLLAANSESDSPVDLVWTLLACVEQSSGSPPPRFDTQFDDDMPTALLLTRTYPVLVSGGIPFLISHAARRPPTEDQLSSHSFSKTSIREFVLWELLHASFRLQSMVPADDPFEAAVATLRRVLLDEPLAAKLGVDGIRRLQEAILGQALAMCEGALDRDLEAELGPRFRYTKSDILVPACLRLAKTKELHWDRKNGRYLVRPR